MSGRSIKELLVGVGDVAGKPRFFRERGCAVRNTVEYKRADGTRCFRLHRTDIVTVSADGRTIQINTGGWNTLTTRDRIQRVMNALGYSGGCWSLYGGRALCFGHPTLGAKFVDRLTLVNGQPVADSDIAAEVEAARKDQCEAWKAKAREWREHAKAHKAMRFAQRWHMPEAAFKAWRAEYRATVRAVDKLARKHTRRV